MCRSTDDGWMNDSSRGSITIRPAPSSSRIERSDRIIGAAPYLLGLTARGEATNSCSTLPSASDRRSDSTLRE